MRRGSSRSPGWLLGRVSPPPLGWKPDEPNPRSRDATQCWDGQVHPEDPVPGAFRCPSGVVSVSALRAGRRGWVGGHPGAEPTRARAPTTRGVSAQAPCGPIRPPRHPRGEEAGQRSGFGGGWGRGGDESGARRSGGPRAPEAEAGAGRPTVCSAPRRTAGHRTAPGGGPGAHRGGATRAPFLSAEADPGLTEFKSGPRAVAPRPALSHPGLLFLGALDCCLLP